VKRYIAFDFETGGMNPKEHPILTGYFTILDENLVPIDNLEIKIAPEFPYLDVQEGALKVNGIDMETHLLSAQPLKSVKDSLVQFLEKHYSKKKGDRLRPLGQNILFDLGFLFEQLIPKDTWERYCHYVIYDTKIYSDLLKEAGILPPEISDLSSLAKFYHVPEFSAHDAKADVLATVEVYRNMLDSLRKLAQGKSMPEPDLIRLLEQ